MFCGSSKGSVDIITQLKAISRCKSKSKVLSSSSSATSRPSSSNTTQSDDSGSSFGGIPVAVSVGVGGPSDDCTDEDYLYSTDEVTLAGHKNLIRKVRLAKCEYDIAWTLDSEANHCMRCTYHFSSLFLRKHHCRICGFLVCTNCSPARLPLKGLYERGGSRVCTICYDNQASLHQQNANTVAFVSTAARLNNTSIDGIVKTHISDALPVRSVLKPKYDCSPYPCDESDYDMLCVSSHKHALQKERYSEYNRNGEFVGIPYKRAVSFGGSTYASSYSDTTTTNVFDQMAKLNAQLLDKKHQLDYEKGVLSKYSNTPSHHSYDSSAVKPSGLGVWESCIDSPLEFQENINTSNNVYFKTPTVNKALVWEDLNNTPLSQSPMQPLSRRNSVLAQRLSTEY